ncbi:MAG: DMT family transporter [Deltaproteobacteria bacterium]|nr:DMT family transporter [Deltaproteobacteria bacterium]
MTVGPEDDERRGVWLLVGAAFWFSAMSSLVKVAGKELPLGMATFARSLVTLVFAALVVRRQGLSLASRDTGLLVLRGLFGLGGIICFFSAILSLPVADATVLQFTNPLLTTLLAAVVLKERPDGSVGLALCLGFAGTLLVARPASLFGIEASLPRAGVLVGLAGATFSACAYVTIRRVTRTTHPDVVALYFPLVATPATFLLALRDWTWPTPRGWLLLLAIGCVTHMGQLWMTRGLARVPVARGTAVGYLQIPFAAAWGLLFFSERPTLFTLAGAALIVAGALLLVRAPRATPHAQGSS